MAKGKAFAAERDAKRRTEELSGVFVSTRWSSPDGTFIIAQLQSGQTVKGNARAGYFIPGCEYLFSGHWEESKYGLAFSFKSVITKDPVTLQAVCNYIERHLKGLNTGIGSVSIGKLAREYTPALVCSTIRDEPAKVASFLKIDIAKARLASEALRKVQKYEATRIALTELFQSRGFPQETVERCIDVFGVSAVEAIKRDPFTMLVRGFPGCGFLRVNALYDSLNLPPYRLKRQVICMWHLMHEGNGSVWYDSDWVCQELTRMVSTNVKFKRALALGIRAKWLSSYRDQSGRVWLAAAEHAACEAKLVNMLGRMITEPIGNRNFDEEMEEDELEVI